MRRSAPPRPPRQQPWPWVPCKPPCTPLLQRAHRCRELHCCVLLASGGAADTARTACVGGKRGNDARAPGCWPPARILVLQFSTTLGVRGRATHSVWARASSRRTAGCVCSAPQSTRRVAAGGAWCIRGAARAPHHAVTMTIASVQAHLAGRHTRPPSVQLARQRRMVSCGGVSILQHARHASPPRSITSDVMTAPAVGAHAAALCTIRLSARALPPST